MKYINIFLIAFLFSATAHAEDSAFICKGSKAVLLGDNIFAPNKDSGERVFDLMVNTKKPDIYGVPGFVVSVCIDRTKGKCSIDQIGIKCECESEDGKATVSLSRNTGKLVVIENLSKSTALWEGNYMCSKVTKKLF